ncbi:MAG TPA: M20/M25/M40 family metallo-hydrolase, partial [Bacteroidota bacterium]
MKLFVILLSFVWTPFSFAQVAAQPQVREALEFLKAIEAETIAEQIAICEIPAPPFKEQQRAEYLRRRFTELGLSNVRIDAAGNVIGERAGETAGQMLALSAHLDTVFPEGTDVTATRTGTTIKAPGIGDDSRGLAVLLAVARVLQEQRITTRGTIMFIGTVGEEGIGDLRGVRHVFTHELKDKVTHFISLDGTGLGITHRAVGSHRYKVTFKGPGGHSYGAFGMPNPVHALGRAVEKISRFEVPKQPKTTFNVGRVEGGTSVNSIAHTVWMEMD